MLNLVDGFRIDHVCPGPLKCQVCEKATDIVKAYLRKENFVTVANQVLSRKFPGKSPDWDDLITATILADLSRRLNDALDKGIPLSKLDTSPALRISRALVEMLPVVKRDFFDANAEKLLMPGDIISFLWHLLKTDQVPNPSAPRSPLCAAAVDSLFLLMKRVAGNARDKDLALSNVDTWQELGNALSVLGDTYTSRNERIPSQLVVFTLNWWYNSAGKSVRDMDTWIMSVSAFDQDTLRGDNEAYEKDVRDGLVNVYGAEKVVARMNAQLRDIKDRDSTGENFKCGIGRGLFAALYALCLHYLKAKSPPLSLEMRNLVWDAMASVVRGSLNVLLITNDGKIRTETTPTRMYTALALVLYGGAEFLAYGVGHLAPLFGEASEDVMPRSCKDITYEIRWLVYAINTGAPQRLQENIAEAERQKMLTTLALFRSEFQKVWWSSYRVLKEVIDKEHPSPSQKELLKEWQSLSNELGLSDSKESAEYQKGQAEARKVAANFCAWVTCRYNSEKLSSKLCVCAGCGEVAYCSRDCQKAHWKSGRKRTCQNRIKSQ